MKHRGIICEKCGVEHDFFSTHDCEFPEKSIIKETVEISTDGGKTDCKPISGKIIDTKEPEGLKLF